MCQVKKISATPIVIQKKTKLFLHSLIIYVFILIMEINKLVRIACVSSLLVQGFGVSVVYSNSLLDCCGLLEDRNKNFVPQSVQRKITKSVPAVNQSRKLNPTSNQFRERKVSSLSPISKRPQTADFKTFGKQGTLPPVRTPKSFPTPTRKPSQQVVSKPTIQNSLNRKVSGNQTIRGGNNGRLVNSQPANLFNRGVKSSKNCFQAAIARQTGNGFSVANNGFSTQSVACRPSSLGSFSGGGSSGGVIYAPRMKSIRVTSAPNIDGWEKSLREEMRLNGRAKHTINRLLYRIQDYYEDPTIEASDYAPGNEGYQPSAEAREIAETRIRRSVESMAEFYKQSGNPSMDTSKSANGAMMMKGKLTYINTQLDKLGKPRVGIDELREIVGMKINPPAPMPIPVEGIAIPGAIIPDQPVPQIANRVEKQGQALQNLDLADLGINNEDIINGKVDEIYLTFARWLADNDKTFPSLDPEVDNLTLRYFELVNRELRELGKFENLQIFRQKTLAHLDEVLDDRGLELKPGEVVPDIDPANPALDDDPLFRGQKSNATPYVHLASLPGNVVSKSTKGGFEVSRTQRRDRFDDSGNRVSVRVMNNLPGRIIH